MKGVGGTELKVWRRTHARELQYLNPVDPVDNINNATLNLQKLIQEEKWNPSYYEMNQSSRKNEKGHGPCTKHGAEVMLHESIFNESYRILTQTRGNSSH